MVDDVRATRPRRKVREGPPELAISDVPVAGRSFRETAASPVSDDLASGQLVIGTARWILVFAGILLALWNPGPLGALRIEISVILLLAVANFYLYTQIVTNRHTLNLVAYGASAADLVVVTLLILAVGGSMSNLYIFYFPAILGLAVVFRADITAIYTGATMIVYAIIALNAPVESGSALRAVVIRVLMLAAVAVCGNMYQRIERDRRRSAANASRDHQERRSEAQEELEDVFFGQRVIIWARWFVIVAVSIVAITAATTTNEITTDVLPVIVLLAINFYLHGRYLLEKPGNRALVVVASLVDLIIISAIVATWHGESGLQSFLFVLYYPILVTFAFVLPRRLTVLYTLLCLVAYSAVCLATDSAIVESVPDLKSLVMRLITIAAVGSLGTYYWRIQRDRRRAAVVGDQQGLPTKRQRNSAAGRA
jgi:hypothetical protein